MSQATAFTQRFSALTKDSHVKTQAERLMPVLQLIRGTKDCPTLDQVIKDIAIGIIALETSTPRADRTANVGGITIERGPMDGYSVHLWAVDIFHMRMDDAFERIKAMGESS